MEFSILGLRMSAKRYADFSITFFHCVLLYTSSRSISVFEFNVSLNSFCKIISNLSSSKFSFITFSSCVFSAHFSAQFIVSKTGDLREFQMKQNNHATMTGIQIATRAFAFGL
jgi:hypothetical protein